MKFFTSSLCCLAVSVSVASAIPTANLAMRAATDNMTHGNYFNFNNQVWRYYQISDGFYTGYLPHEWPEDDVHPRSLAVQTDFDSSLSTRDLVPTCRQALTCVSNVGFVAANEICLGTQKIWSLIGPKFTTFVNELNKPFAANLAGVGIQNAIVTWGFSSNKNDNTSAAGTSAAACSSTGSQADVAQALLRQICALATNADGGSMSMITPDGTNITLMINVAMGNTIGGSDVCGAPGVSN